MQDKIIAKLFSGRYFLTVCAGVVFVIMAFKKWLPADVVAAIITMVFTLYFTRDRKSENEKEVK